VARRQGSAPVTASHESEGRKVAQSQEQPSSLKYPTAQTGDDAGGLPPTLAKGLWRHDWQQEALMGAPNPKLDDDFNLESLRLDQSFIETAGVKKLLTTVPVRRPNPQDFIRVHSDSAYRANLAVIELRDEREMYLLTPQIAQALPGEYAMAAVFTAINRQGVVFLWPVKLPQPDGKVIEWHRAAAEAAELAMSRWVRVKANMALGAYEIFEAQGVIPDPTWPDVSFEELLRIGFRGTLVNSFDHPLIKRLHGIG
jgi:hypothetical protein